jgi:hypothetical protein
MRNNRQLVQTMQDIGTHAQVEALQTLTRICDSAEHKDEKYYATLYAIAALAGKCDAIIEKCIMLDSDLLHILAATKSHYKTYQRDKMEDLIKAMPHDNL